MSDVKYAEPIARLVNAFKGLPGIGEKTASRLALFVLNAKRDYAEELGRSLIAVKDNVSLCPSCMTFSDIAPCGICRDPSRDRGLVCVVGDYKDMVAIESAGTYKGLYHVLHGLLAPLKGIGPDDIKIDELLARIKGDQSDGRESEIEEVIVALGFDGEGEATALYIQRLLGVVDVKVTRIASGVPVGGSIEYMDSSTLGRAFEGRKEV